jgi:outer membrane protein TolC
MKRYLILCLCIGCTLLVFAQAIAETRVLSLEECLRITIERSATVGVYREQLRSARQDVLANYGRFLPNATVSSYVGRTFIGPTSTVAIDTQGRPIQQAGDDFESYSFGINSSMMLFDWGVNVKSLTQSKRLSDAAGHDLQYQKDLVTAQVIRAYYDLVRKKNLRVVQQESVNAARRNLEQVEAFFRIGSNTRADVLQAKVRLGNTRLELITATNSEEIAQATLASLLNFPLNEEFDIDSSLRIEPVQPSLETEVEYMLEHRPDLLASRRRVQASKDGLRAAQNSRWPTLGAGFQYNWNDRDFAENANFFKSDYNWGVGISLNFNVFDRFATRSSIAGAKAQERIAEYNLQQAKLDAILEVKQLILSLQRADERMRVSEETVTQAKENLRLAEERYRVGAGTILETIEAGVSLTEAQASLIDAKCDHLIASADLLRATGRQVQVD